jgi:hypothetical protein
VLSNRFAQASRMRRAFPARRAATTSMPSDGDARESASAAPRRVPRRGAGSAQPRFEIGVTGRCAAPV